ncbi:olfactory receptor 10D3-like [Callithrix jacchus]
MEIKNDTLVTEFMGIPHTDGQKIVCFVMFVIFYLCMLLGNLLILLSVMSDSHLHMPMYFLVCNLSALDIGFSFVSTPKILANLLVRSQVISLGGCMCQVFFHHFLGSTECLLYTVMAYDGFATICCPLCYTIIMNCQVCVLLAAGTWFTSSFHVTILTTLTFQLPYCNSNEGDYFFCDIFPVVRLACDDTLIIETVSFTNIGLVPMTCFLPILASYIRTITAILKMQSAKGRRKAASTCGSHLSGVTLFFGPYALIYTQPSLSDVLVTLQIFVHVVTPMLNPTIYTLRNQDIKGALKKLAGGQIVSEGGH